LKEGEDIFNKHPDEIAADMARLSPSDREFYRLGAAGTLRTRLSTSRLLKKSFCEAVGV